MKPKNKLCSACKGKGQTKGTMTIVDFKHIPFKTIQRGSGCPSCFGTGIVGERK